MSAGCDGNYMYPLGSLQDKISSCRLPDKQWLRWTNVAGPILPERDCSILASAVARASIACDCDCHDRQDSICRSYCSAHLGILDIQLNADRGSDVGMSSSNSQRRTATRAATGVVRDRKLIANDAEAKTSWRPSSRAANLAP